MVKSWLHGRGEVDAAMFTNVIVWGVDLIHGRQVFCGSTPFPLQGRKGMGGGGGGYVARPFTHTYTETGRGTIDGRNGGW